MYRKRARGGKMGGGGRSAEGSPLIFDFESHFISPINRNKRNMHIHKHST